MSIRFHTGYFLCTTLLFIIEVLIAIFVHDRFVRPYMGDVLVVILIYCFIKTFFNTPLQATCYGVLLFACAIEFLQYLDIVQLLGLGDSRIANIVIGNSFAWMDMVAYTAGIIIIWLTEKTRKQKHPSTQRHKGTG